MLQPKIKFLIGEAEIKNKKIAFINTSRNAEPHNHYFVEIVYFHKGTGTHIINNRKFPIKSGDVFLINPFTKHSYTTNKDDDSPVEVYNIIFYTNFLSTQIPPERFIDLIHKELLDTPYSQNNSKTKYLRVSGDVHHSFLNIFKMIEQEYLKDKEGSLICLKNLLVYLIINIFRRAKDNSNTSSTNNVPLKTKQNLELAIEYLKEHPAENITLSDFSKKYFFSVSYFNKIFKKHTGLTLNQYLQQERMSKAAELLHETDLSIDEICGKVGYSDIKYFYSTFSKFIGVPPAKYRSYIRKELPKKQS